MASLYSNGAPSAIEAGSMGKRQWEREQQSGVRRQRFFGKVMREARRRGDMETYLRAESMGFRDQGIVDFKESREQASGWVEKRRGLGEQFLSGGSASDASGNGSKPSGSTSGIQTMEIRYDANGNAVDSRGKPVPGAPNARDVHKSEDGSSIDSSSGSGVSDARPAGMSFAEQDAAARERSNASGAFGDKTPIVSKSLAEQRRDFATKAKGIEAMGDSAEDQERLRNQAFAKGKQLGLNDDQIEAALRGSVGTKSTTTAKPEKRGYEESDRIISEQLAGDNRELKERLAYLKQQTDDATAKSDQASIDTALTAQEGKDRLRELNMKQTKDSTERNLQRLASEELARLQKSRTDDYLRDDKAPDAFSGRIFDSWQSDPSLQLTDAELKEAASDPSKIRSIVQRKVNQRDSVDKAFNAALGGEVKVSRDGEIYDSDSVAETVNTALGLRPNYSYDPNRVFSRADTDVKKSFSEANLGEVLQLGYQNTIRPIGDWATRGTDKASPFKKDVTYANRIKAQDKLFAAAEKTGYPIWENRELMSDPMVVKRLNLNPVLKQRMEESKRQKKEGDRSARILAAFNSI